ncbi:hypothetical protein SLEP1_g44446 [Rubroshorea leprosula]|uniref:Uncharacterized protein n=1 Tax=Rubroshorea leprosula TaxID=152421 RepID=A0AAV5LGP8_9ROSI|nr:hypothetical protein SLEP1_g44446 [Rubroshorea leprosula]
MCIAFSNISTTFASSSRNLKQVIKTDVSLKENKGFTHEAYIEGKEMVLKLGNYVFRYGQSLDYIV